MKTVQFVSMLARRTSQSIAIAALALGMTASASAPTAALAAPSAFQLGPDLVPAFSTGGMNAPGERFGFMGGMTNRGDTTATNVRMVIGVPDEVTQISINPGRFTCSVAHAVITCTIPEIGPGQSAAIAVHGNAPTTSGRYNVLVRADPQNSVRELSEGNNDSLFFLGQY
ncbi:MAG: CARDB domain-containing protein [Chloroflexota bacterium]